jgi:NTE family protein
LEPDAYAGASSGALVAAFAASGVKPLDLLAMFQRLRKEHFWDPPTPAAFFKLLLKRFRGRSGYLAGQAFTDLLERDLPAKRFEDCLKPCLVVSLDINNARRVVHTKGPLVPAVVASGAVPVMFNAVKHGDDLLLDGGLVDKAPLLAAREHLGAESVALHHLPSASLTKPVSQTLAKTWAPLRLQARAVDAARLQVYQDQLDQIRSEGVSTCEVRADDQIRVGPKRLHLGCRAFEQARQRARTVLGDWQWS